MLFGIQGGPRVPKTPETQHRANQSLRVCKWVRGQYNIRATASSEQPPEVSGHIPGVIKISKYIISTHIYFSLYFTWTKYFSLIICRTNTKVNYLDTVQNCISLLFQPLAQIRRVSLQI
jgi:hypothetical protein